MLSIAILWIFNKFYAKNFLHLPATLLWECNLTQNPWKLFSCAAKTSFLLTPVFFGKAEIEGIGS